MRFLFEKKKKNNHTTEIKLYTTGEYMNNEIFI